MNNQTPTRHLLIMAITLSAMVVLPGCKGGAGYSASELFPTDVRTVAVEILQNRTFYRGVEFDVTEALTKELELRTPYKVVAKGSADTVITGTILSVEQRVISRTFSGGIPQEVQVNITVSFEWKDMRTGNILSKYSRIVGTGEHAPTRPVAEPYQIAQHTAAGELAREMVSVMRSDW